MKRKAISLFVIFTLLLGLWSFVAVPIARAATCTWNGSADSNWATSGNWTGCTGGIAPATTDSVLLDNSIVAGSYTVNLQTGATSVSIVKLTITPDTGNVITVILPSGNTSNPGFNVGDNTSSTDDIILNDGAILKNSSGATAGNGIQVNSVSNGTLRINNGGKYIHNTARSSAGTAPLLSTASGTETGIYEYDSSGTGSVAISASGRTYGTLILTRTAGAATYTASGGSALTIKGDFIINSGVTFNSTMTGALNVDGKLTNNGPALVILSAQAVNFNGSSAQLISGSGSIDFNSTVSIANAAGVTLGRDVGITGVLALTTGDLNTGVNTLTLGSAATSSGTGDVIGDVKRTSFAIGTTYSFGNPNVSLNFASATTLPTDVTINLAKTQPGGFLYAIDRTYKITENGGVSFAAMVRLHYLDTELHLSGGATESSLHLFKDISGTWTDQGRSGGDTTNNWAEQSSITSFSDWTLAGNTPTAITLSRFDANSESGNLSIVMLLIALSAIMLSGALIARRRRI